MELRSDQYGSPLGTLLLAWSGNELVSLDYADYEARFVRLLHRRFAGIGVTSGEVPRNLRSTLDSYFAGSVEAVDALPVRMGGSEFENRVWAELRRIGPGTTSTYGSLAAGLGIPSGARAVGRANSMNPIAIVVPCHRVIGANATLTGYAGGLERKQWLLDHEKRSLKT